MITKHVPVGDALERMWIRGNYSFTERETTQHLLMSGRPVSYRATGPLGADLGTVKLYPENNPVTLVTEINL